MPCIVKKTCDIAQSTANDVVIQVKSNQKFLHRIVTSVCDAGAPADRCVTVDHGHGRDDRREIETFAIGDALAATVWNDLMRTAVKVHRITWLDNSRTGIPKPRESVSYYLVTATVSAGQAAAAIRDHWSIETRDHRVRDGALADDASRLRKRPGIMARMRSFALNILRASGVDNITDALYQNSLSLDRLLTMGQTYLPSE